MNNWTGQDWATVIAALTSLIAAITALMRSSRTEGKVEAQGERQKGQAESIRQVRDIAVKTAADLIPPDAAAAVWESVAKKAVEEYVRGALPGGVSSLVPPPAAPSSVVVSVPVSEQSSVTVGAVEPSGETRSG